MGRLIIVWVRESMVKRIMFIPLRVKLRRDRKRKTQSGSCFYLFSLNSTLYSMNISVVIPVYNEEDSVQPLFEQIKDVFDGAEIIESYEVIFIDDGSRDSTYERLSSMDSERLKVFRFKKNKMKTAALHKGFSEAGNEIIVTLDGDLQDDPGDIPGMLQRITEGYDAVVGWRQKRNDSLSRVVSSRIANIVRRSLLKDKFHDIGCPLRVFKREVIGSFENFEGAHRFFPYFMWAEGFRVDEYPVRHHSRKFGKSKYGIKNRLFKTAADLVKVRKIMNKKK